jgi:hypothetical protein
MALNNIIRIDRTVFIDQMQAINGNSDLPVAVLLPVLPGVAAAVPLLPLPPQTPAAAAAHCSQPAAHSTNANNPAISM